jgi:hypothetical protein
LFGFANKKGTTSGGFNTTIIKKKEVPRKLKTQPLLV